MKISQRSLELYKLDEEVPAQYLWFMVCGFFYPDKNK